MVALRKEMVALRRERTAATGGNGRASPGGGPPPPPDSAPAARFGPRRRRGSHALPPVPGGNGRACHDGRKRSRSLSVGGNGRARVAGGNGRGAAGAAETLSRPFEWGVRTAYSDQGHIGEHWGILGGPQRRRDHFLPAPSGRWGDGGGTVGGRPAAARPFPTAARAFPAGRRVAARARPFPTATRPHPCAARATPSAARAFPPGRKRPRFGRPSAAAESCRARPPATAAGITRTEPPP